MVVKLAGAHVHKQTRVDLKIMHIEPVSIFPKERK